ncbi:MAG: ZIP family metal transporter [Patescibacteria group bacterium]|nr:ZIP family metal transporter [Patescibacteria group bacterium]
MLILYAFLSALIVSLISLIGVFTLSIKKEALNKIVHVLVAFAVGGLFGDAIIHLIPEAFKTNPNSLSVSLLILLGIFIFFGMEKILRWRHCHESDCPEHHHLATMNLVGDAVHNFIDGLIIGVSFMVSLPLGLATTVAVVLHEIPQEVADFGVLIYAGVPVKKALGYNFLSALLAVLGP